MSNFSVKPISWVLVITGVCGTLSAQTLSFQQALDAAVQHHPAAVSAGLQARQQRQLLPAATALPDPVVTAESPTGDFYTVGVAQSFALPVAYRRQKALQQAHVERAESAVATTQQQVKYQTALAYNDLQYRIALVAQLRSQDSLLQNIAAAAALMFEQGRTDAVASQFARLQAASLRMQLHQAEQDALIAESQLQALTGITNHIAPEPMDRVAMPPVVQDSAAWNHNPALQTLRQEALVAERQVAVEKSRGLPQLTLGYLNQGARSSPVGNRFNAGISIPLWRKRYNAGTEAAQTGAEVARQNLGAESLALDAAWRRASGEAEKSRRALEDYEQNVLPAARSIGDASRRLFEGGLTDLVSYLRNRKDVTEAELGYWELLRAYQAAGIELKYLSGTL